MSGTGATLRMARLDRRLELDDVSRATKIRVRYLAALENEQLDLLPGRAYARGFLRDYAQFLQIDPEELLDGLAASSEESEPLVSPFALEPVPARGGRGVRPVPAMAVGVALLLGLVAIAVWPHGGSRPALAPPLPRVARAVPPPRPIASPARSEAADVALIARDGDCWVEARVGSATGPLVHEGTLAAGETLALGTRRRLWLRLGAPWNVEVRVGGVVRPLRSTGEPVDLLVTRTGVRPV